MENQLIQSFTGKANLSETTDAAWSALIRQYPAFNIGYYLRAKKQQKITTKNADEMRWQAALRFNDIRWLDYLLKLNATDLTEPAPRRSAKDTEGIPHARHDAEPVAAHWIPSESSPAEINTDTTGKQQVDVAITPEYQGLNQEKTVGRVADTDTYLDLDVNSPDTNNHNRLSAVLSAQLADFNKPVAKDARLNVDREPLYKVDYFASQGIAVLKTQDSFDKKVRKFTDWLKEMKQQGADTNTSIPQINTTPQEEAAAAEKAEKSLNTEPVWTQSMAEVLASQGKTTQAREVYQKLSLLYPEKSAYFASKIDLLQ